MRLNVYTIKKNIIYMSNWNVINNMFNKIRKLIESDESVAVRNNGERL